MDNQTQNPNQPNQQPVQQYTSVGRSKEMPGAPSNEWVAPSTPEVVLPQEVKEAGVEAKPSMPSIPQDVAKAGVVHAKEATPAPTVSEPFGMKTPRSVLQQLKETHKKVTEGFSWLVRLIIKEQDKKEKGASL